MTIFKLQKTKHGENLGKRQGKTSFFKRTWIRIPADLHDKKPCKQEDSVMKHC